MGIWRKFWRVIDTSGKVTLGVVGSLISIASFVGMLVTDDRGWVAWVAILFFVLFLVTVLVTIMRVLNRFLESANGEDKESGDYKHISTFFSYTCNDGDNIVMETYKWIQVKCSLMWEYPFRYRWSGTQDLKITSDIQKFIRSSQKSPDESGFDHAILKFSQPLIYNDVAVVHVKHEVNDADHKSFPYYSVLVDNPVECIHIRILLGYKTRLKPAKILRRRIVGAGEPHREFDKIGSEPFDEKHRCYSLKLVNPDVYYEYRLEWER